MNEENILEDKLLKIFGMDNDNLLQSFLHNLMVANRASALAFLEKMITKTQGRQRFKMLEFLGQDGGKDVIPLFITAIKLEKNVLFGKSVLFLFGNFQHSQALNALLELEDKIHFDLKKSYQKVAGKLKGRFRELFYISEFKQGDRNPKRMNHAAEMMAREPHPAYLPFLNQTVKEQNFTFCKVACRVIGQLGDEGSLEALCETIPALFETRTRTQSLAVYMTNEATYDKPKLKDIIEQFAFLGEWEEADTAQLEVDVRGGKIQPLLNKIKATLLVDDTLITQEIFRFLELWLAGNTPPKSEVKKLERLFKEHGESQSGLLQEAFQAAGLIGHRHNVEGLFERMELLGVGSRDQPLIAAFLGGYQCEASLEKLISLLDMGENVEIMAKAILALEKYELNQLPEPLVTVAEGTTEGFLRQKAMSLIAKNGFLSDVLDRFLANDLTIVQVDAIQTVATYKNEPGYLTLLDRIHPDMPVRLLEVYLQAFESFPDSRTGEAVKGYMVPPHPYMVRSAALRTLTIAGGSNRFPIILGALEEYPEKSRPEIVGSFIKMVEQDLPMELFKYLAFWRDLLNKGMFENLRPRVVELITKINWEKVDGVAWADMLGQVLENSKIKRSSSESKTLRVFALRARSAGENVHKKVEKKPFDLGDQLNLFQSTGLHEKVRVLRLVNLHYKAEWFNEDEPLSQRLMLILQGLIEDNMGVPDLTKIALSLIAKMKHPDLIAQASNALPSMDAEMAAFAQMVLHLNKPEAALTTPIRSVLILDDTVLIARTLQRYLTKSGFEVSAETEPAKALLNLENKRYDLLILDLLMPGMDGLQFLEEIRKRGISPNQVLIITSSRERDVLVSLQNASVQGVLLKPFPIQNLLDKIESLAA